MGTYPRLLTSLLAAVLITVLGSCATSNTGLLAVPHPAAEPAPVGVHLEQFTVGRYNAAGRLDAQLNRSLSLTSVTENGITALTISVSDNSPTATVALEVDYNEQLLHPLRAEFHGLLGAEDSVVRGAFLDACPGLAGLGEVRIGATSVPAVQGRFATLYFAAGAPRQVAANSFGAHSSEDGVNTLRGEQYDVGWPTLTTTTDAGLHAVNVTWNAGWHTADGDRNNEVNASDITPIGTYWMQKPSDNWLAIVADYDDNNEVSISDMTPIGRHFKETTNNYLLQVADDAPSAPRTNLTPVAWEDSAVVPLGPPTYGDLSTVFPMWGVIFNGTSELTYSELQALDTGGTPQVVNLYITPQETFYPPESTGNEAFIALSVPPLNSAPVISSATFDSASARLTVLVSDADGDPVDVSVTEPAGLTVDALQKPASGGSAVFSWIAEDIVAGGAGQTSVTATDGQGEDTAQAQITVPPLAADTLYVVPHSTQVFVGHPVRVSVVTGPTASPLIALEACHVTVESGGAYVDNSFNIGAPGGEREAVDGAWTQVGPTGFNLEADGMIVPLDIGGGRVAYTFRARTSGGSEVAGLAGELFNFELMFSAAGTYRLGFRDESELNRTWYLDGAAGEHQWGILMADITGSLHPSISGRTNQIEVTVNPNNHAPVIENVSFDAPSQSLSVTVSDQDNDPVAIEITPPTGLMPDFSSQTVNGSGTAQFYFGAEDPVAGGSGLAGITASDPQGANDTADSNVSVASIPINADTIYALPLAHSAAPGQPVRVFIYTGATAHPFKFLNGCGITVEADANYYSNSYNIGFLGGEAFGVDGVWSQIGSVGFLQFPDWLIVSTDIGGGRQRFDFSLVPLGGAQVNNLTGYLFNMALVFSTPGTKQLGLVDVDGVDRTYYSDDSAMTYHWGTLMADGSGTLDPSVTGVDNTLIVE